MENMERKKSMGNINQHNVHYIRIYDILKKNTNM